MKRTFLSPNMDINNLTSPRRRIRNPELNDKLQWTIVIQFHMFVSGALALIVYGVVELTQSHVTSASSVCMKVGAAGLVVCYVLLLGWALLSFRLPRQTNSPAYEMGTKASLSHSRSIPCRMLTPNAVAVWSPRRDAIHRHPLGLRSSQPHPRARAPHILFPYLAACEGCS
jgi:hypothetical protein